jgi:hypothetical protein
MCCAYSTPRFLGTRGKPQQWGSMKDIPLQSEYGAAPSADGWASRDGSLCSLRNFPTPDLFQQAALRLCQTMRNIRAAPVECLLLVILLTSTFISKSSASRRLPNQLSRTKCLLAQKHTIVQVEQKAAHVFIIYFPSSVCFILRNNLKRKTMEENVLGKVIKQVRKYKNLSREFWSFLRIPNKEVTTANFSSPFSVHTNEE